MIRTSRQQVMVGFTAAALGASMIGGGPMLRPEPVRVPEPRYIAEQPRRKRKRAEQKRDRARQNHRGYEYNASRRKAKQAAEEKARQLVVGRMTNWQRTQWASAGYPVDLKEVERFAAMPRRSDSETGEKS